MKVGDKVIYNKNIKATVILSFYEEECFSNTVHEFIQIRFETETNLNGVTWWAEPESLTLDAEWLREEKLKELGI